MEQNAYKNELDAVGFTEEGRAALTDALMNARSVSARRRSWPRKGLAAVLAAVLLVGSAVAATGPVWNHVFGGLNEEQQAVIDTLSQDLPAAESNGTVMTPLAAFGDQDFYYLLLEITPPEGVVLPNYGKDEGYYQFMDGNGLRSSLTDAQGQELQNSLEYSWLERSSETAPLTAAIRIWPLEGVDFSDGSDKILTIPGLWVQSPYKDYTPVLTGSWSFNIGAHTGGIQSQTLEVSGTAAQVDYCDSLILDSMRISPLGMRWQYHWTGLKDPLVLPGVEVSVVMEDGSEIQLANNMGSFSDEECWSETYGPFESPVDLDRAVFIRWGDAEIPLN